MQCMVCGEAMRVERIVRDESIAVSGFEHHTLTCVGCGESEERLVFTHATPSAEIEISPGDRAIEESAPEGLPESMCAAVYEPMPAAMPEPVPETAAPSEPSIPVESVLRPAAVVPPRGAWALAIERIRVHQTVLAQRATTLPSAADVLPPVEVEENLPAEATTPSSDVVRPAPTATAPRLSPATPASDLDDFDRLWESLARPLPERAAVTTSPVVQETRTIDPAPPAAQLTVLLPPVEPPPATPVVATVAVPAATAPRLLERVPTAEPKAPQEVFPNALSRAVALLRGRRSQRSDAILRIGGQDIPQISDEALRLSPPGRPIALRA